MVLDRPLDTACDYHGPGLAADLILTDNLFEEMVHHDLCFIANRFVMGFDILPDLFSCPFHVELGVALHRLDKPVVAINRGVILQHVQDKPFLNGLLHSVTMERPVLCLIADPVWNPEHFESLVFRRRSESEITRVGH